MYGLYQGYIGGPNIRRRAYAGNDVYRALENNAIEFINSNRGTDGSDEKVFKVSSLYERNRVYFPDFTSDLTAHLKVYLEGYELTDLQNATKIKADINDWTVTDLGGTHRDLGAVFADNNAALLDSVKGTTPADGGGVMAAAVGAGSSSMAAKGSRPSRIDPNLLAQLHEINVRREQENIQNATVTVEELGEAPVEAEAEAESDPESDKKDND
jgi:hypothetical protein